jgi:hypothetical protein
MRFFKLLLPTRMRLFAADFVQDVLTTEQNVTQMCSPNLVLINLDS